MSIASNTPVQFVPGIGRRTAAVLHDLDIHTFGQLARIPDQVLVELFGPSIKKVTSFGVARFTPAQTEKPATVASSSFFKRFTMATKLATVL
ncbi:MAG: hypothetical protein KIH62_001095 [Candidatus Kerfeldbacteria bacterium]|nr:hypothetical protein [Candidatus Kerfeldbacteria bacterium]